MSSDSAPQRVCILGSTGSIGGNTLDVNSFSCTLYFNGQPTVTEVTP